MYAPAITPGTTIILEMGVVVSNGGWGARCIIPWVDVVDRFHVDMVLYIDFHVR